MQDVDPSKVLYNNLDSLKNIKSELETIKDMDEEDMGEDKKEEKYLIILS